MSGKSGTRVGNAFIALTVDGDGVNKDIADSIDDVDYKEMGEKHGGEYSEGYFKRISENIDRGLGQDFRKKMKDLNATLDTDNAMSISVSKMLAKSVDEGKLDQLFKRVGEEAGADFGDEFDRAVRVSVINTMERTLEKAVRDVKGRKINLNEILFKDESGALMLGAAFDDAVREAEQSISTIRKRQEKEFASMWDAAHKEQSDRIKRLDKEFAAAWKKAYGEEQAWIKANEKMKSDWVRESAKEQARVAAKVGKQEQSWLKANADMKTTWLRESAKEQERLAATAAKQTAAWEKANANMKLEFLRQNAREQERLAKEQDRRDKKRGTLMSNMLSGRAFGRGSRMDGLHYFGGLMGVAMKLTVGLGKAMIGTGKIVGKVVSTFAKGFEEAGEAASTLRKIMSGFASLGTGAMSGLSQLLATGPAGAIALAAAFAMLVVAGGLLLVVLSALASIIGALLGIITALVGVISMALVGSLLILGGTIMAVVAAAGLAVAAFKAMDAEQKNMLKESFAPLKDQIKEIGSLMMDEMAPAFEKWGQNTQRALALVTPLAGVMGSAFARAGTIITNSLSGPGFRNFTTALATYLPGIVINLSRAFGGFMNGLTGMFAAVMPHVSRFASYLADVGRRFSEWANSAKGQNAIVDFANKAEAAIKATWGVVTEFGGVLKDLLFNADTQAAGVSMFDSIKRALVDMRDKIKEATRDGSLKKWLKDAEKFGGDLWETIEALAGTFQALYDDGTITAVGDALSGLAGFIKDVNGALDLLIPVLTGAFVSALGTALGPIGPLVGALDSLGGKIEWVIGLFAKLAGQKVAPSAPSAPWVPGDPGGPGGGNMPQALNAMPRALGEKMDRTARTGRSAANNPALGRDLDDIVMAAAPKKGGGGGGKWSNPYKALARRIYKEGPGIAKQLKQAMIFVQKQISIAFAEAARAGDVESARSSITSAIEGMRSAGQAGVQQARDALNAAALDLGNASTPKAAKKALKAVAKAQKDMLAAQKNQKAINAAAKIMNAQKVVTNDNVKKLVDGLKVQNATLADFAAARSKVAEKLAAAKEKLEAAISLRDSYRTQITESIKGFGNLLSAQGQILDGVEQEVTATDIVSNLKDRLTQIRDFQSNLRILLAQGLSNEAYKQILDGGVEVGGAYAEALLAGGSGAITETNELVKQISSVADILGLEASNRMYQAGVDSAKGLVDGLNSLSKELDSAAAKLGESIAKAVKKALGIKSPSRVLWAAMDDAGDGIVGGLDAQHQKVESAAASLAGKISIKPRVSVGGDDAQGQGGNGVSGNSTVENHWHITTPTEDPKAVAQEMINEMVGRL